ncbi:UV-stimulated scaffold protein A-like isoform X3 [Poecilia reticulata]|uniref:UV-stimulated scaffold protein A-like isoform X3 n=1 Tax=Poecilia reticulata TaxID=8081 RepID=UPI0004A4D67E|nr:PREDICTED: UV-stimulated scaffold protein A-like isoform X3 [Poecilia reticulata]
MELSQRERLSQLVEELTTSGQPQLNQDNVKELKKICKASNDCIDHVYHSVMTQLNQEHAEIRLSAFQIASELFSRSHHFRTLLVDNFQEFLELTVETDSEQPLPPPKEVARKLRSLAIQTVQSWHTSYGSAYKKLELGYHFLKQVKKVDFQDAEARTITERRRKEERQRKMERIYKARVEAATKEMEESYQDIEAALTEMESCMKLLFPEFGLAGSPAANSDPSDRQPDKDCRADENEPCCSKNLRERRDCREEEENSDTENREKSFEEERKENEEGRMKAEMEEDGEGAEESSQEESDEEDSFIRNSGLISHTYSLDVSLSSVLHVKETEDNEPVVSTMMELHKVFTKSHAEPQLLRRALSLRKSLEAALQKHRELHIDCKTRVRRVMKATSHGEEDDDEDEFEEVPEKEGYEPHIPEHLRAEYGLDPAPSTSTAAFAPKTPPVRRPPASPLPSSSFSSSRRMRRLLEDEQDPTSAAATLRVLRQQILLPESSSSSTTGPGSSQPDSAQDAAEAPVVPFGLDLYYWGQEQPNAGKILKSASQHQFWVPAEVEEEVENQDLLAQSKSRYISFPGNFVPVSHFCRAPLGNGTLCQRQDRIKCPFHGLIIPRDQEGQPCREEDRQREEQEERRKREQQQAGERGDKLNRIQNLTSVGLLSEFISTKMTDRFLLTF